MPHAQLAIEQQHENVPKIAPAGAKKSEGAIETPRTVDKSSMQHAQLAIERQTWKTEENCPFRGKEE
jgi:hypothetical protein